jgi:hypothetical protein
MTPPPQKALASGLLLIAVALVGCTGMGRFDLDITLDHTAFQAALSTIPSVEINFVGVNASEYPVWHNYSVNKYWMPEDAQRVTAVRQGHCHVVTFGEQPPFRQAVSRTAPMWDKWKSKGSRYLFVLVNYPRTGKDLPGDADARRVVLPLDKQRWHGYFWGRRTLRFEVTPGGIVSHTPPMPPAQPRRR